jgi:hypothetical protein
VVKADRIAFRSGLRTGKHGSNSYQHQGHTCPQYNIRHIC